MNLTNKKNQFLLLCTSFLFYMFFFFVDGYVLCADSNSYIHMYFFREPLYPLYLAFFRVLLSPFGDFYLYVAVLGQSLLAAYAAFSLTSYLQKECILPNWISYILLSFVLGTSLLCRYAAQRKSMYSNSIMSEGLAISIYLLFIRYCYEYISHKNKKSFFCCLLLCLLGISCRKQMTVLLILFCISIFFVHWKKSIFKGLSIAFITGIFTLFTISCIDHGYNYMVRGQFESHVDDNRFITTVAIYTADRNFVNYIDNEEIQNIFLAIYDCCSDNGYLMNQAPSNWYDACDHFADHYDLIQIDTMLTYLNRVIDHLDYANDISSNEIRMDLIKAELNRSLIPLEIPRILTIIKNNFLDGLVNTVAKRTPLLCIYSIFIYLSYIILYLTLFILRKKKGFTVSCKSSFTLSTLVLTSIFLNNLLVSSVIFAQTRYVIYNMPLFYMSGFIMLINFSKLLKKQ